MRSNELIRPCDISRLEVFELKAFGDVGKKSTLDKTLQQMFDHKNWFLMSNMFRRMRIKAKMVGHHNSNPCGPDLPKSLSKKFN